MSLLDEIDGDLQRAPRNRVLYVEGATDPVVLFALLGVSVPADSVHEGVFVRELRGSQNVRSRVELAHSAGRNQVFGMVDGDGRDLEVVEAEFGGPGPTFSWPAYSIESVLVAAGWPSAWGEEPDWRGVLSLYGTVAARNRLVRDLEPDVRPLVGLVSAGRPGWPKDHAEARATLAEAQRALGARDLGAEFDALAARFVALSVGAAHAWLDGKWLIHHVATTTGRSREAVRREWARSIAERGGDARVRAWCARVAGTG